MTSIMQRRGSPSNFDNCSGLPLNKMASPLHSTSDALRIGLSITRASGAVVLLHGRGASAEEIVGLAKLIGNESLAFIAPNATDGTWYPQRFLVPLGLNEPWLSSALEVVDTLVGEVHAAGLPYERIGLAGFSQGACLALEYAARHPRRYGFVAGLSGALIGPLETPRPAGDLKQTPILVACAERDAHIPLPYVERSASTLSALKAEVTKQIFPGVSHTIFPNEIEWLSQKAAFTF